MIYLGADHGGFQLKEKIKEWLSAGGQAFEDLGAFALDSGDDYPQFAFSVAKKVGEKPNENQGILLCRSGGGMTIAANRVKGARAVDCLTKEEVVHARQDNNANILVLAGDWLDEAKAKELFDLWFATPFSNEPRHVRRIAELDEAA